MPRSTRHAAVTFAPLSMWPATHKRTADGERRAAQFRAPLDKTYGLLAAELARVGAVAGKIELDIDARALRGNGQPYAGYTPKDPGVVLRFVKDGAEITMPCDQFETWADNLRGIALTLVSLRALDRYGASASGQQYRGYAQLPSVTTPAMTKEQAAKAILRIAGKHVSDEQWGKVLANPVYARDVLRLALKKSHPETSGSNPADFGLATEAKRILQGHHGIDL